MCKPIYIAPKNIYTKCMYTIFQIKTNTLYAANDFQAEKTKDPIERTIYK